MGSLLENPWVLAGAGFILEFLLLSLTYRAGYAKGISPVNQVIDESSKVIQQLHNRVDFLRAEVDSLRRVLRLREKLPPTPPENNQIGVQGQGTATFSSGITSEGFLKFQREETAALRALIDSERIRSKPPKGVSMADMVKDGFSGVRIIDAQHETCGDPECPHCGMEKPQ